MIDNHEGEPVTLAKLSEEIGVSTFHLQRTFKSIMGISPSQYAEMRRIDRFKQGVREGESIANATYDAGFGSSSRLYEGAAAQLGMTPATYGKGGRGAVINYAIVECELGKLMVAATSKGLCSVKLGDSVAGLEADLSNEFPAAEIGRDEAMLASSVRAIVDHLSDKSPHIDLPLDIRVHGFSETGLGATAEGFRLAKPIHTATSLKQLDSRRRFGRWHGPARRIQWRLSSRVTG